MGERKGLHVNVGELLKPGVHGEKTITIDFESFAEDPEIKIIRPIVGTVRLIPAADGVVGLFQLDTTLELACSVDSEPYQHAFHFAFQHEFGKDPETDQVSPIANDRSIDIAPVIWDEIVVSIPMKPLCPKHQDSTSSS